MNVHVRGTRNLLLIDDRYGPAVVFSRSRSRERGKLIDLSVAVGKPPRQQGNDSGAEDDDDGKRSMYPKSLLLCLRQQTIHLKSTDLVLL